MNAPYGRQGLGSEATKYFELLKFRAGQNRQCLEPVADFVDKHQHVLNHQLVRSTFGPFCPDLAVAGALECTSQGCSNVRRKPVGLIELVDRDGPNAEGRQL